jgi:hypothetical protein
MERSTKDRTVPEPARGDFGREDGWGSSTLARDRHGDRAGGAVTMNSWVSTHNSHVMARIRYSFWARPVSR